jgi:hypothetical protein
MSIRCSTNRGERRRFSTENKREAKGEPLSPTAAMCEGGQTVQFPWSALAPTDVTAGGTPALRSYLSLLIAAVCHKSYRF